MELHRPPILIAAPRAVIGRLSAAVADAVEVIGAETWDEALERLQDIEPRVVVVCYVFDEMRPFRLLHYLRYESRKGRVPTLLVRAVPVKLGSTQEAEISQSYMTLGVDEFINLHDEERTKGRAEALERFRHAVLSRLDAKAISFDEDP
jgi:PleD family two-component response regulator